MSFTVRVQPGGQVFTVDDGESVLDAALRHGLAFPYGCRDGVCGSCRCKVLAGTVTYPGGPPPALAEDDPACGMALMCQARPATDLIVKVHEVSAG
ncbi:MAG: 2Fe-2S iron-sulfur cluster binding domain-containing protein [Pseudomonadota bacterium]|nr:MAG: 2Fe-2S iron-sulfur cluster binding domain-containing protein [Pseudomonadota bacterium]